MKNIPDSHADLLKDEAHAYAYLATVMKDGSPQLTPLWFNVEDDHVLINSARGRLKDKNMRARPNIALLITDPKDPYYRYMQIRGRVVEITEKGADEHINRLNMKYHDGEQWKTRPGQVRVIYRILPEKVFADE
jgi:PPOX class probable F420-dependent enzyme